MPMSLKKYWVKRKPSCFIKILFGYLFAILSLYVQAQTCMLQATLPLDYEVVKATADRYNNFFLSDNEGNIRKYSEEGILIEKYSPPKQVGITLLEGWHTIRIFAFYRDIQEYTLLNRLLSLNDNLRFTNQDIGFVRLATIAADGDFWLFDEMSFALKKYDPDRNALQINSPLDITLFSEELDLTFMREYQNLLFISDRTKGVLVFDNLGNYSHTIPINNLSWYGFTDDYLYYIKDDKLFFQHLYKEDKYEFLLPEKDVKAYLVMNKKLYLFGTDTFKIYRLKR
jgi:WD40 repeat protein